MTNNIDITSLGDGVYGVTIDDGSDDPQIFRVATQSRVMDAISDGDDASPELPERVVRESVNFLLEREPAEEILERFSLDEITRYWPEYPEEIRRRVSAD